MLGRIHMLEVASIGVERFAIDEETMVHARGTRVNLVLAGRA
jgi:hypothetical protein